MGVVYRATDTTLDRSVALKFVTAQFGGEARTRARFLREARATAALNHPAICTIHEVGEVQPGEEGTLGTEHPCPAGTSFIAMELIEGRTLEALLRERGRFTLEQLLDVAIPIAEGLAAAHAKGVVHRDLKPSNVMVTPEGRPKILDFGLAKLLDAPEREATTAIETESAELTRRGQVLGTATYMSPEQAAGRPVDSRSDLFSFGVMLYEIAAGERPFRGDTPASTLAKILETEPKPLGDLRGDFPEEMLRIVRRCLRKDPADRYNDTRDLVVALKDLRAESASGVEAAAPTRRRWVKWAVVLGACVLVAAVFALRVPWFRERSAAPPTTPRHRQATFSGDIGIFDLSPDGRTLAYVTAEPEGRGSLIVQDIAGGQPLTVYRGSTLPQDLRWSPDGSTIVIRGGTPDALLAVPRLGGAPRPIAESSQYFAWSSDGIRIATVSQPDKAVRIADTRKRSTSEVPIPGTYDFICGLDWSPRAELLAVITYDDHADVSTLRVVSIDGRHASAVFVHPGEVHPVRFGRGGDAVYCRTSDSPTNLWMTPVNPRTGAPAGEPRGLLAGIQIARAFSFQRDGVIAYAREIPIRNIWRVESPSRPGDEPTARAITSGTLLSRDPALSPDRRTVAFSRGTAAGMNIFTVPADGGSPTQLTYLPGVNGPPVWSPDGRRIGFTAQSEGNCRIAVVDVAAGKVRVYENTLPTADADMSWAPSDRIVYQGQALRNFVSLDPETEEERALLSGEPDGWVFAPRPSPDGRSVAIYWNRRPQPGIWLLDGRGSPPRLLSAINVRQGYMPIGWMRDGSSVLIKPSEVSSPTRIVRLFLDGRTETAIDIPFRTDRGATTDGKTFYVQRVDDTSDVWLAENFDPGAP